MSEKLTFLTPPPPPHLLYAHLQACNFIKKRLQYWCFPVKFAKCLRTSVLKSICSERLLLFVSPQNISVNILNKFLTLCSFEIFCFTPGKLGRYDIA